LRGAPDRISNLGQPRADAGRDFAAAEPPIAKPNGDSAATKSATTKPTTAKSATTKPTTAKSATTKSATADRAGREAKRLKALEPVKCRVHA
jgi:hypothetical protein